MPLLIGVGALFGAHQLGLGDFVRPGPGLWPFIAAAAVTVTSVFLVFVERPSDHELLSRRTLIVLGCVVSPTLFIILFQLIGFLVPAFLLLLVGLKTIGEQRWRWALLSAVVGTAALHLLFVEALGVPFPRDVLLSAFAWIGF